MATGGAQGSQFVDLAPILTAFWSQKQATGHKVGPTASDQLPKISDETYSKNNSKMLLIFWLLPPTRPKQSTCPAGLTTHGLPVNRGAGGSWRQPLDIGFPKKIEVLDFGLIGPYVVSYFGSYFVPLGLL